MLKQRVITALILVAILLPTLVVDAAIDTGVSQVVALSTDKAVNPVNIYGATKLCEEKIIIQGNAYAARSETTGKPVFRLETRDR